MISLSPNRSSRLGVVTKPMASRSPFQYVVTSGTSHSKKRFPVLEVGIWNILPTEMTSRSSVGAARFILEMFTQITMS